jgi:tellurite resistance protein
MLQNPAYNENQQMKQILMSHIQDHLSLKYRQEMAQMIPDPQMQQMIMSNPPQQQPGQPKQPPPKLPPELENQIAMMAANAADSVLQLDEEKARIMAGEKKDPQIELQEKDLALRAQKMMNDLKVHEDKMALEEAQTIIKDENTDEDRELRKEKIMIDQMNKESEMKQELVEKAMDVAAQTGASAIKISGEI